MATWAEIRAARVAQEDAVREAMSEAEDQVLRDQMALAARLKGERGDKGDKGDKGDPGAQGAKGDSGIDGHDGANGRDGADGSVGPMGADGLPGRDGVDGSPGQPGERGPRGAPGVYVTQSSFQRDQQGQRIEAVVEQLSDGTQRTFSVQRDSTGRPVELVHVP